MFGLITCLLDSLPYSVLNMIANKTDKSEKAKGYCTFFIACIYFLLSELRLLEYHVLVLH